MDIPSERWYPEIFKRRSRRKFDSKPIPANLLSQIDSLCTGFQPFKDARSVLITESPETVFKGAIGSYGKIKGAPAFIAFIGNVDSQQYWEQVGYTGEGIILEAGALGLSTCWVAGFFQRKAVTSIVELNLGERVEAVTPIGFTEARPSLEEQVMTGFGLTHRRKPLPQMVTGISKNNWPQWVKLTLEAARLAPSAINRQPWRFQVNLDSITVSINNSGLDYGLSKRLCCGIAMLHIEVAALACGVHGSWTFLEPPQVARFTTGVGEK